MQLPPLTPSNELAIAALTKFSEDMLNPIPWYEGYASKLTTSLTDDPRFSEPLYIGFEDYDYSHNVSNLQHIYLNDFDFNLEEDREELVRITRMEFEGNSFDTVARCRCNNPKMRGNYLLNSGRLCPICGSKAETFLNQGEDSRIWLRCPEGVKKFINIGFFTTFFNNMTVGNPSPKIGIVRYFADPVYRAAQRKNRNGSNMAINQLLSDLGIYEVNLNTFYDNCDKIMEYLLIGPGTRWSKYKKEGEDALDFYRRHKEIAFCDYIKVPNRYCMILEKSGKGILTYQHHPETAKLYHAIADTMKSTSSYKLTDKDIQKNIDIVGKSLIALADQYRANNNPKALFNKQAINRKHVCAGPIPCTGRSVITSKTGIIDGNEILVPWRMAVPINADEIKGYLYRKGYSPLKAAQLIIRANNEIVPEIAEFFKDVEDNRKCIVQAGRNPSIEYLSRRSFFLRVNRDLEDESIKISILSIGPFGADFDGDQMYLLFLMDNESKAKAYGALGHHQVLDKNSPFKVSKYAGQSATNLMNLNTLFMQTELTE